MLYVIVVGGGKVGFYLTKQLLAAQYEVVLLEKNWERHHTIAEQLGDGVVLHGDGCEVPMLLEVGVTRADIVVAATGDDEDNLVVCQMAQRRFGVKRVIARINNPKNEAIFQRLGIHETVNGTAVLYQMIEQEVETDTVIPLAALQRGNIEIVEAALSRHSPVLGKSLQEIVLPEGSLIISIIRNGDGTIPNGGTCLEVGDTVIALVKADQERALSQLFAGKV